MLGRCGHDKLLRAVTCGLPEPRATNIRNGTFDATINKLARMRAIPKLHEKETEPAAADLLRRLAPASHDDNGDADQASGASPVARRDDLPYKVELWDAMKNSVEQVLAVTRNGSIGYAAYYEATRQFPDRYVTLRHNGRILSRFNGPTH